LSGYQLGVFVLVFKDRRDAGQQLAAKLIGYKSKSPFVLGIPRGGVVVAAEVARELGAPLDVIIPRKIGAPFNKELAVGAVAPDGTTIFDERALFMLGLTKADLEDQVRHELEEIKRRSNTYRGNRRPPVLEGKTVIMVDDGIATGMTAMAALESVRKLNPDSLVLAVPVASMEAVSLLKQYVDELVCLLVPDVFYAVGQFYRDFGQTSDQEVINLLKELA